MAHQLVVGDFWSWTRITETMPVRSVSKKVLNLITLVKHIFHMRLLKEYYFFW